jgi:hypothetical protein
MTEQNNKPNFDFIMNQPGSELETPKRSKKPVAILIAAVVFLGVLTAIGLVLARRSTNVQQIKNTGREESSQFLLLLADGKTEEAYNMYEQNSRPDKEFFMPSAISFPKRINMKACVLREDASHVTDATNVFVYRCNYFDKPSTSYIDFAFVFQQINGKKQLTKVQTAEIKL